MVRVLQLQNPKSGKFIRQSPIFFNLNRSYPNFDDLVTRIVLQKVAPLYKKIESL